jgi:hypothetical protein
MRFEEAYERWNMGRLTQGEAAQLLGVCERGFRRYLVRCRKAHRHLHAFIVCERGFRRYLVRYEADGLAGLVDRRLEQASQRQAPVDEVLALTERYRQRHLGWNVRHFHSWYRRDGGERSYSWVKQRLQGAGLVAAGK